MKMKSKALLAVICAVLLVGATMFGTLAYLTDKTAEVKNTFTVGNVDIDLEETTTDYKMVPNTTIDKDPTVTVSGGSEACYLFVKVEESDNLEDFISYTIDSAWTLLTDVDGVYYLEVSASETDQDFGVLTDDQVSVRSTVTKAMMDALTDATAPTLTFTAYAVQSEGVDSAADAWAIANPASVDA